MVVHLHLGHPSLLGNADATCPSQTGARCPSHPSRRGAARVLSPRRRHHAPWCLAGHHCMNLMQHGSLMAASWLAWRRLHRSSPPPPPLRPHLLITSQGHHGHEPDAERQPHGALCRAHLLELPAYDPHGRRGGWGDHRVHTGACVCVCARVCLCVRVCLGAYLFGCTC